jgi:hypothetical protein
MQENMKDGDKLIKKLTKRHSISIKYKLPRWIADFSPAWLNHRLRNLLAEK